MGPRFAENWSEEFGNRGAFPERDLANFLGDMKRLIENPSMGTHPTTVVQAFERIEKHYSVPECLSEPMRIHLIRKATLEGRVSVIRCLVERWDCPLPLDAQEWRRVSLLLEWSIHEDIFLEWSADRERHLLRKKHASLSETHPETAEAL